jgi:hypothetical protein
MWNRTGSSCFFSRHGNTSSLSGDLSGKPDCRRLGSFSGYSTTHHTGGPAQHPFHLMENIREEETEPLAASPPRRIAEAYSHNDSRR